MKVIKSKSELSKGMKVLAGYAGDPEHESYAAFGGNVPKNHENGKIFTIEFDNTSANSEARTVAIFPGYFPTAAEIKDPNGNPVAAIITEGVTVGAVVDTDNLSVSGDSAPVDELLYFVSKVPTAFSKIRVEVDEKTQLNQPLQIKKLSPFDGGKWETKIKPSNHRDLNQQDTLAADIPAWSYDFQADDQTVVLYTIGAGRKVTMSFYASEFMNLSAMLDMKRKSK